MYNFFEGTCVKIEATNNSKIAHVMVEDVLFRFPETGMHILAETGATIEHITLLNDRTYYLIEWKNWRWKKI